MTASHPHAEFIMQAQKFNYNLLIKKYSNMGAACIAIKSITILLLFRRLLRLTTMSCTLQLPGIFLDLFTFLVIFDHLQPVVEAAVNGIIKSSFNDGLMENKPHKGSFEVLIAKLAKAFEDASDAEIVMHRTVEVTKSSHPVASSFYFT